MIKETLERLQGSDMKKTFDDVKKEVKVELGIPFDIQYPYTQEEKTMITETDQTNTEKGERRTETHKFPGEQAGKVQGIERAKEMTADGKNNSKIH